MLRIATQPRPVRHTNPRNFLTDPVLTEPVPKSLTKAQRRRIIYLLGQSLGDMGDVKLLRSYVAPGADIKLKIGFRHHADDDDQDRGAIEALAFASLWLTCAYGGVGARTRRGFGGMRITGADGELPGPWDATTIVSPGLDHYGELKWLWPRGTLTACVQSVFVLARKPIADWREVWGGQLPSFPVLSVFHAPVRLGDQTFLSWQETMVRAGEQLRQFRADQDIAGAGPGHQARRVTREWQGVVNGGDDRFQLGALGLPVVYKDDEIVRVVKRQTGDELRRASPLWLRPVGEDGQWRLLSFAFLAEFLPDTAGAEVRLDRPLTVTDEDVRDVTAAWIESMAQGRVPERPPTR